MNRKILFASLGVVIIAFAAAVFLSLSNSKVDNDIVANSNLPKTNTLKTSVLIENVESDDINTGVYGGEISLINKQTGAKETHTFDTDGKIVLNLSIGDYWIQEVNPALYYAENNTFEQLVITEDDVTSQNNKIVTLKSAKSDDYIATNAEKTGQEFISTDQSSETDVIPVNNVPSDLDDESQIVAPPTDDSNTTDDTPIPVTPPTATTTPSVITDPTAKNPSTADNFSQKILVIVATIYFGLMVTYFYFKKVRA